jgi:hypothetical protein
MQIFSPKIRIMEVAGVPFTDPGQRLILTAQPIR